MKKVFSFLILVVLSFAFIVQSGCKYRSSALGLDYRVFVFADSSLWTQVKDQVEETFHDFVYTPRAERSFVLSWQPLEKLAGFQGRMNIMFIGTTQNKNQVNDYLLQSVPEEFVKNVNNNSNFYFFKDDLFVHNQISLFMMAKNAAEFKENFGQLKDNIYKQFSVKYFRRLKESMYENGEQEELAQFLDDNYNYRLRLQPDYFLANQKPEEEYVWLRRLDPDRWISVWKLDKPATVFSKDTLIAIRNRMTKKYYDGDVVVENETNLDFVDFRDSNTEKLAGTWKNDSLLVGGPFRMYVVKKPSDNSVYMLDIAVMALDKKKKPFLDQLEVIASTFAFTDHEKSQK